jgi:hypothetical protein
MKLTNPDWSNSPLLAKPLARRTVTRRGFGGRLAQGSVLLTLFSLPRPASHLMVPWSPDIGAAPTEHAVWIR